ncbi:hypothetical protein [Clostridium disporicum]|uniref:hypothetical protein n=1 Tax=Clostridium disporicum TaxID=84024 RepID=UPI0006DCAF95|nr:hypothetical protein [Clostridium disporicum]
MFCCAKSEKSALLGGKVFLKDKGERSTLLILKVLLVQKIRSTFSLLQSNVFTMMQSDFTQNIVQFSLGNSPLFVATK